MKRVFRIARRVLAGLLGLAVLAVALLYVWSTWRLRRHYEVTVAEVVIPTDAAAIERGRHLANNVALCSHCHADDFGGKLFFDGGALMARLPAPNLTRGKGGATRDYTDVDWVRAVRHGVDPDGRALLFMPSAEFARFSADDLGAIVAYVKSRPSVDREWPSATVGPIGRALMFANTKELLPVLAVDHAAALPAPIPARDVLARGRRLVSTAGCTGCHAPDLVGGSGPPPGAANITPVGLRGWSEQDFVRTLRTGVAPGGRELSPSMPRAYGLMSDDELHAIWTYLQTVPAKGDKTPRQNAAAMTQAGPATAARGAATAP